MHQQKWKAREHFENQHALIRLHQKFLSRFLQHKGSIFSVLRPNADDLIKQHKCIFHIVCYQDSFRVHKTLFVLNGSKSSAAKSSATRFTNPRLTYQPRTEEIHSKECTESLQHSRYLSPSRNFVATPLVQHSTHFQQCPYTPFLDIY